MLVGVSMTVLFTNNRNRSALSRGAQAGRLRRIAAGIYTDEIDRSDADVVARHRWEIVAHLIPDAVIVDRSAASSGSPAGEILFVASEIRRRDVRLPGLTVAVREGRRLPSDQMWANGLLLSSPARTLVDNLALSRGRGTIARTLSTAELGDWMARQARLLGDTRLNRLRDEAKGIAQEFGLSDCIAEIDALVGAALGTRPVSGGSRALTARSVGRGFDEDRVRRFDEVATALIRLEPSEELPLSLPEEPDEAQSSLGFWEAYFSNHIEGTAFAVDEAEHIVRTGELPADRPADGHDVLGTYQVVTDAVERMRVPFDVDDFYDILLSRHATILGGRPDGGPGRWKRLRNQAGGYVFVDPDLVEGTLAEGLIHRERLTSPFARALYMFFLVSEVHPFTDGNGRVARTVMNAEFSNAGQSRIVIPIVWRNEYFSSVRQLSREGDVLLYARTLAYAWRWTAAMRWSDAPTTMQLMTATNALTDSTEASETGRRLLLP
jgi:Fic/DOC family